MGPGLCLKLGRAVGGKCVNSVLSSAVPLYSQGLGCEARPRALAGKISVGGGGSLLLSVVKAERPSLQPVSEAVL